MEYANTILETIGNTPLVKMNRLTAELPCLVLAKYETFNPGNSVKDRMALQIVEDAEEAGISETGWNHRGRNFRQYGNGIGPGRYRKGIQDDLCYQR